MAKAAQTEDDASISARQKAEEEARRKAFEALQAKPKKEKPKRMRPNWRPEPYGHRVKPQVLLEHNKPSEEEGNRQVPDDQILTAYLEPIDQTQWKIKPLPRRTTTAADLTKVTYPQLNSCSKLMEQWPVDEYSDADPYLPWIHDVFPTYDGQFVQFVAQNKNRCHTGTTDEEEAILEQMRPQTTLLEHVPIKKLEHGKYRLASHEEADPETMATRFICKFKPSGHVTFSEFNFDYEWVSFRKTQRVMFDPDGRDIKQLHTSQLLFKCPIPPELQETIKSGDSVVDDWATIFVDVIPIRTEPRYGHPGEFLVPKYSKEATAHTHLNFYNTTYHWGDNHILPELQDSGRWANIPICKPSLMEYEPQGHEQLEAPKYRGEDGTPKNHHLVSCLWASAGYTTRGHRFAINDGQRRLLEWITFNKMLGWDHFYIYDNTAAFTNETSLQPIADMFPNDVTILKWPSRVCNNNPNNVDSPGERSSQYAAEASCRLRFGPHVNWIGQFDIDEYMVPMGEYNSMLPLLEKLDSENKKIISMASWRAWPRATHINPIVPIKDNKYCGTGHQCFDLSIQSNTSMLEAYNCDRNKPGQKTTVMPAEKQIYRADYVKQHFVHYSTVTESTLLPTEEFKEKFGHRRQAPDPLSRFGDEVTEGLMIHSKAVAHQDTAGWLRNCHKDAHPFSLCRLGYPYPKGGDQDTGPQWNEDGWKYNCFVNEKVDNYWAPLLKENLIKQGFFGQ
ncbi:unnamed protein product [Cylindrotheca closterium]|uniref:Glycosyltransferase family 92 protein n=1 Tax=Cylindrotheca closterium TaxID=2856 RepID=A0AAD2FXZ3_9STRA|nr:unnamed protein product [Cylindrotheca closterium]